MKLLDVIHASCKGQKKDHPYQDFIKLSETEDYFLATLADGLGSSRFSSRGASLICQVVCEGFSSRENHDRTVKIILENAIDEWYKKLSDKQICPTDCLTTSSVLFVNKVEGKAYFAHIGDSMMSYRLPDGKVHRLNEGKEFLNETACIGTEMRSSYSITEVDCSEGMDFLMASDGFGDEIIVERMGGLYDYFKSKYSAIRADRRNRVLKIELAEAMHDKNNDDKSLIFGWIH